jgi:hypothetical protein
MRRALIWLAAPTLAACTFAGSSGGDVGGGDGDGDGDGDEPDAGVADAPLEPACAELPPGALAWWDGEVLGEDILATFNMDRTTTSPPRVEPGLVGDAMTFADEQDIIFDDPPQAAEAFTVEGWIKREIDDDDDWVTIYGVNDESGVFLFDNRINFWDDDVGGSGNALVGDTVVPINGWHHVAVTWDGETLRAFLDGAADGSAESAAALNMPVNEGRIGGVVFGDGQDFIGQIDELTIYGRALESTEVRAIAEAGALGKCK